MPNEFSVAAHFPGEFDEDRLQSWVTELRSRLEADSVSLGLVFMTPGYFEVAEQVLEILRVHGHIPLLMGCSSTGLVANDHELENTSGLVLALHHLPDAEFKAFHFDQEQVEEAGDSAFWHGNMGVKPDSTNGWLVFADPFHMNPEEWLRQWNEAYPGRPILGGLASGAMQLQRTQLYLNGEVYEEGGVALSVGGGIRLASVISQGCTPIGETWTITKTQGNIIVEIGNRPAYQVLMETIENLGEKEQRRLRGNLFVGLVINEYLEDFQRGDFLIRNLIGADPNSGALVIGAVPRPGQTLQFQRRDAEAANEDMDVLLGKAKEELDGRTIYAGTLHCCNGRGRGLFNKPGHDAGMIQDRLGPFPMSGFFCNGELGPIGDQNFLHGYTASLALFVEDK